MTNKSPSRQSGLKDRLHALRKLGRLIEVIRPHRGRFVLATLALFAGSGISLLYPQALRMGIDRGLSQATVHELDLLVALLAGLFLLQSALTWVRHYLMSWLGERAVAELRHKVFSRLLYMDPAWFGVRSSGAVTGRLAADTQTLQGIVGGELSLAMRHVLTASGGVVLMAFENLRLAALALAIVPPLSIAVVWIGTRIRSRSRAVSDRLAEASARVQEAVGAIETVQAFGAEKFEAGLYGRGVDETFQAARRLAVWRGAFIAKASLAGLSAVLIILWSGGRAVVASEMSAGDLAAFVLYSSLVGISLGGMANLWGSFQRAAGATERLFSIVDDAPTIRDPDRPVKIPTGACELRFEDVHFRYPNRADVEVLAGIDFRVEAGSTVALVGRSGAGKTTLGRLVPRFYDVERGRVLVGGVDVREASLHGLRERIALVSQEPVLFSSSVLENIRYGAPDVSIERVRAAARDAQIAEFIESLPEGYDTVVGERGIALSGGQRQRVAIARAILADPDILILDEATSHLDAESEAAVQAALKKLLEGRTALVIAHRLSTVRRADRIVVLDSGRVAESGNHESLMAQDGLYRRLVELSLLGENADRMASVPLSASSL